MDFVGFWKSWGVFLKVQCGILQNPGVFLKTQGGILGKSSGGGIYIETPPWILKNTTLDFQKYPPGFSKFYKIHGGFQNPGGPREILHFCWKLSSFIWWPTTSSKDKLHRVWGVLGVNIDDWSLRLLVRNGTLEQVGPNIRQWACIQSCQWTCWLRENPYRSFVNKWTHYHHKKYRTSPQHSKHMTCAYRKN